MKARFLALRMRGIQLLSLAVMGALSMGVATQALAIVVSTTQLTSVTGNDLAWGQGITVNVGADVSDALIPATIGVDFVGFRIGDPAEGAPGRTAVYLHIYDGFGINPDGTIIGGSIGSLVGVSNNVINLETTSPSTDVIWTFDQPAVAKGSTYHYIMADDTVAATSGDFTNLIYSELAVGEPNPHAGGQLYRQDGDEPSRDLYFRMISSSLPDHGQVPEPSSVSLLIFGLLLARLRRHRQG